MMKNGTLSEFTIEEAVEKIIREPAPILFPDTCALVDIIRIPMRVKDEETSKRILNSANEILSAIKESPNKAWIVIAPPIFKEWSEHSKNTKDELLKHLLKLDTDLSKIHSVATNRSIQLKSQNNYANSKIDESLLELSKQLLEGGLILSTNVNCVSKGSARAVDEVAPAKKGKSHKDCLIVEHILLICAELNKRGFDKKKIFLSSNTADFYESGGKSYLRPPLDTEFSSMELEFTTTWDWAKTAMGI